MKWAGGEGYCFVSHFLPRKLPSSHFSTSFVEKSIHENKHSGVFAPRPSQFRFCACPRRSFPRGLIVFTCHIRFIPTNVILPRYWEHLFAPRPWMEVLEREFIFLNPLLISSLRCSGGAAHGAPCRDGTALSDATASVTIPQRRRSAT